MPEYIKKRDGRLVPYDEAKIAAAIDRAFVAAESGKGEDEAERLAKIVTTKRPPSRIFRIRWSAC